MLYEHWKNPKKIYFDKWYILIKIVTLFKKVIIFVNFNMPICNFMSKNSYDFLYALFVKQI